MTPRETVRPLSETVIDTHTLEYPKPVWYIENLRQFHGPWRPFLDMGPTKERHNRLAWRP